MRIRKSDWYQTKVRYEKTLEDGRVKKAAEHYVVEASSHTEAEARIAEEMACCINGEFEVAGIFPASYKEIFYSDRGPDEHWYKVKLHINKLDEKTDKEKRLTVHHLIQAATPELAIQYVRNFIVGAMTDYSIVSITEPPILDVF